MKSGWSRERAIGAGAGGAGGAHGSPIGHSSVYADDHSGGAQDTFYAILAAGYHAAERYPAISAAANYSPLPDPFARGRVAGDRTGQTSLGQLSFRSWITDTAQAPDRDR